MYWNKLGLVYGPDGSKTWAKSHAMIPTPFRLNEEVIRVYVTFCDGYGIGRPGFVDVCAKDPRKVLKVSEKPLLEIGEPGTFDENGILVCSVIASKDGRIFLYYVGFELGAKIRYRLLTGLAVSNDRGNTFERYSKVPILERSDQETFFRCGPYCVNDGHLFKLWYVAGSSWTELGGKSMPVYDIRYIESEDGIRWPKSGEVQIPITELDEHGFGRPCVISGGNANYRMFYSVRRRKFASYRLGYAESFDGHNWQRMDDHLNLDVSAVGFDSDAIMYAAPIMIGSKLYVFYNGNNFGKDGFAVALLES